MADTTYSIRLDSKFPPGSGSTACCSPAVASVSFDAVVAGVIAYVAAYLVHQWWPGTTLPAEPTES